MVSAGPGLHRARSWAALAMLVLASALTVRPMVRDLADPGWPRPDEFQAKLDAWARTLAPVESSVPAGEPLTYACPTDGEGRPLPDFQTSFDVIQAVLAPRRIGRAVESRYVLAHSRADGGQVPPSFGGARVLAELAKGLVLLERAGP